MRRIHDVKIDDAKYYEKIWAVEYNTRPWYDTVRQEALAVPVQKGDSVLDVGGGVFGTAQYIAEHHPELEAFLTIVDQSHTAAEIVTSKFPEINFVISDVIELPFRDHSFDVVVAGEIIEHMEDPAAFAKELRRVTRIGGTITLSTVDTECENAIAHGDYPEHLWEFTPRDLQSMFGPGAKYTTVGDYHFLEVAVQ